MMWYGNGFHWGWMLFGGLMMLLFWGGLIALAVVIIRAFSRPGSQASGEGGPRQDSALEILNARYARGEITKEQFDSIRRDIVP
ncbi:MAG: SHOCT domain-containing protein [Chloroflexota bacterium]